MPPLFFNGTEVKKVIYDGVELSDLYYNGTLVFKSAFVVNHTISTNQSGLETTQYLQTLGWDGAVPVIGTLTIGPGVIINAINTSQYGMYVRNLPAGSDLTIINSGEICGAGGAGGACSRDNPSVGGAGGHAIYAFNHNGSIIRLVNNGIISGGGGGGGAGRYYVSSSGWWAAAGGGGGAGAIVGAGGHIIGTPSTALGTGPGSPGTHTAGGAGGVSYWDFGDGPTPLVSGGNGGNRGVPGGAAAQRALGSDYAHYFLLRAGGAAGLSIVGINRIIFTNNGTVYGSQANN